MMFNNSWEDHIPLGLVNRVVDALSEGSGEDLLLAAEVNALLGAPARKISALERENKELRERVRYLSENNDSFRKKAGENLNDMLKLSFKLKRANERLVAKDREEVFVTILDALGSSPFADHETLMTGETSSQLYVYHDDDWDTLVNTIIDALISAELLNVNEED